MPKDKEIHLINWFFVALGIIGVLLAILLRPYSEVFSDLLLSIGSTLIATSLLAYLYQKLGAKSLEEQVRAIQQSSNLVRKSSEIGILNLWKERKEIDKSMWNDFTKDARDEVWLLGVAEHGFARDDMFHQILADGVTRGCNFRILLLDSSSPSAKYWDDRDVSKSRVVPSKIREATEIFRQLIDENKGKDGAIELRVYDDVPSLSIVRADGEMLVTLYISSLNGDGSPTIHVQNTSKGLFSQYEKQFKKIWDAAKIIAIT